VAVELHDLGHRQHGVDPLHPGPARHRGLQARGQLRGVGTARAQHERYLVGQRPRGLQQLEDALLLADAAHEEHVGLAHLVAREHLAGLGAAEGVRVDSVVDDHHSLRGHLEVGQDVGAHLGRHRDHPLRALDREALGPRRDRVAGAELIGLPRAQRLQAVQRDHERQIVDRLRQHAAQAHVPGVGVHHVGGHRIAGHGEPHRQGLERGGVGDLRPAGQPLPRGVAPHAQVGPGHRLVAEAADLDGRTAGQRAAQVVDHHAGAAVDVGRVLAAQEQNSHRRHPGELTA
jgi:hypothetical protein